MTKLISSIRTTTSKLSPAARRWVFGATFAGMTLASFGALPPMTAHFPLDEKSGTVVTDAVGGLKGTLTNAEPATAWIAGKNGGALHLDGKDDRIFVPHAAAIDFADESFTVSFWMRWNKAVAPHGQHLITKGDYEASKPGETGKRWEIYVSSAETLCFTIDDNVKASRIQVALAPFSTGEWVHLTVVRDTAAKQLRFYANGVLLAPSVPEKSAGSKRSDRTGVDITGSIANPQRLTIGDANSLDNPYPGDLDDLRLYRSALTEAQIAELAAQK